MTKQILRIGILCVPVMDDEAVTTVFRAIQRTYAPAVLLLTASALSQRNWLEEILQNWCDVEELDLVLTIGGTLPAPGPSADEIVPEATSRVIERFLPGLAETMRSHAQTESRLALLERCVVGIRGRSLLVNLPAGAAPALLFLEAILDLLPAVVAHLHSDPTAPQLLDELIIEHEDDIAAETASISSSPTLSSSPGLKAEEFAAFLQRNKKQ
ncbi:MAG: molybdopterin-binding protein [Caldilineaceae bacterium]